MGWGKKAPHDISLDGMGLWKFSLFFLVCLGEGGVEDDADEGCYGKT